MRPQRQPATSARPAVRAVPADLDPAVTAVLAGVEDGRGSVSELAATAEEWRTVLRALGELESRGLVVRGFGGRYERAL